MIERGVILADTDEPIDIAHLFTSGEKVSDSLFAVRSDGLLDILNTDPNADPGDADSANSDSGVTLDRRLSELVEAGVPFDSIENRMLEIAVEKANGNLSKAARQLGLTRAQLAYRLKKIEG